MLTKHDMYDVVQKDTDDDDDIVGVAMRYFMKSRDQYKPPSMRCVAKIMEFLNQRYLGESSTQHVQIHAMLQLEYHGSANVYHTIIKQ